MAKATDVSKKRTSSERRITLAAMLMAAGRGGKTILPALWKRFDDEPDLWEQAGNIALQAERSVLSLAAGKNALAFDAMERKVDQLRVELVGPSPTPLERLPVDQIVVCWLQVNQAERTCVGFFHDGGSMAEAEFHQRRLDPRAQKRYLAAIKTLAQVRRLLAPTVQVNIAQQQVNVAP